MGQQQCTAGDLRVAREGAGGRKRHRPRPSFREAAGATDHASEFGAGVVPASGELAAAKYDLRGLRGTGQGTDRLIEVVEVERAGCDRDRRRSGKLVLAT